MSEKITINIADSDAFAALINKLIREGRIVVEVKPKTLEK